MTDGNSPEGKEDKEMTRFNDAVLKLVARVETEREEGQGLVEYALLLTLIAVACIGAVTGLGGKIMDALGAISF